MSAARALEAFDGDLIELERHLRPGDAVLMTADHGNDPTKHETTDHTREYIPIVACGPAVKAGVDLGTRDSLADIGATVEESLGLVPPSNARSFWGTLSRL